MGKAGEDLAAEHLRGLGYEVLARNFRCRRGEIDLVCRRAGEVSLVEVKTRVGTRHGTPAEAIDAGKQRAMASTVAEYRAASGWRGPVRFRLVAISLEVVDDVLS
ncbi:MAG: YraN family protein [Candidatus Dormibacteraeota bacterium]|nr:YraN family protein [Candidatus Dormibacteraeota bacterium]